MVGNSGVGIDAQQVKRGGQNILGRDRAVEHIAAVAGGLADDLSLGDAGAGQGDGIGARPVLAPGARFVRIEPRSPAMLAHPNDQGFVEQATFGQVANEGRIGQIEAGEVVRGSEPGAPAAPALREKAIWTTLVASTVLVIVAGVLPLSGL